MLFKQENQAHSASVAFAPLLSSILGNQPQLLFSLSSLCKGTGQWQGMGRRLLDVDTLSVDTLSWSKPGCISLARPPLPHLRDYQNKTRCPGSPALDCSEDGHLLCRRTALSFHVLSKG